jgi:DNA-binding MarR family transcriptional regulator
MISRMKPLKAQRATIHIRIAHADAACVEVLEKFTGMSVTRWRVLHYLNERGGMTQKALMQHTALDSWSITRTVKPLEEEGLVERMVDPDDNRLTRVQLSDVGQQLFRKAEARRNAFLGQALATMSEEDIGTLARLLEQVEQNLIGSLAAVKAATAVK